MLQRMETKCSSHKGDLSMVSKKVKNQNFVIFMKLRYPPSNCFSYIEMIDYFSVFNYQNYYIGKTLLVEN